MAIVLVKDQDIHDDHGPKNKDVHTVEVQAGDILEDLCRLCGAQDSRLLHLADTFSILGATSNILHLLESISVFLKVQDDCEELMPKHLCLSCFNTAIDIQAFIDSGVNFQKTTISQLFPNATVEEVYEVPFSGPYQNSQATNRTLSECVESGGSVQERPHNFFSYSSYETSGELSKQNYDQGQELTIEQHVNNRRHIIDSYQESQGIFEYSEPVNRHSVLTYKESNIVPNASSHLSGTPQKLSKSSEGESQIDYQKSSPGKNTSLKNNVHDKKIQGLLLHSSKHTSTISTDNVSTNIKHNTETHVSVCTDAASVGDNKLRKCPTCNKTFPRQSQLKSHLATHSELRPFECNRCFLKFKYRRNLVEHFSVHDEIPSFICSVCGLTFKQKSNLLKHERTHREANKLNFKCTFCSKEYTQSSHLKTHIRNIHKDNCGFTCSECNVVVLSQSSLRRHMSSVHATSVKFTCQHCNKGFNNYQNYQGHIRRHTGERPYCCETCNKTFTTTKALSRHRLIHQGTKTHKCAQCGKTFLELCDLKRHVKRHLLKRAKKDNKISLIKCRENAVNPAASVDPGMNSINLMVLTDSLLFTESQQILDNTDSRAAKVIIPNEKLNTSKAVSGEPGMRPNVIESNGSSLQQTSMEMTKASHMLRTEEEVLSSSQLMPAEPEMDAVSLLANTAVLQPPEVIHGITTPLETSQVLQPTNIDVQDGVAANESNQVTLTSRESSECTASDAPTMVMLSSVRTPSEYLPVSAPESNTANPVIDGARHQQSERVLSHATW
ncbi:zinc finger protein with KRAB and SCAN domains 7-like isoform X2 [Cherax quadricarinatus]|uniref:zinc finger protein with KRAB and SCAN domains 7-like isoform X2 n=1 Tax=Cherax quadricarinatus TaxID=27406 RepID=UPI00387E32CA